MNGLSNVTILIFSKDRPLYLKRALNFWSQTQFPIIVSDGSSVPIRHNEMPWETITYLHRPLLTLLARINELVEHAQTKYILFATDDDFFDERGIQIVENFLELNPDYSSAQGYYLRFGNSSDPSKRSTRWHWDYLYSRNMNASSEDPIRRITNALEYPVMHYCYTVMPKKHGVLALSLLDGVDLNQPSIFELSFLIALMAAGKYVSLPVFYSARQAQPRRWTAKPFKLWLDEGNTNGSRKWLENIDRFFRSNDLVEGQNHSANSVWISEIINRAFESKGSNAKSSLVRRRQNVLFVLANFLLTSLGLKCALKSILGYLKAVWILKFNPRNFVSFTIGWHRIKVHIRKFPIESN